MKTCEILTVLRKNKKLSQKAVADILEVSPQAYQKYEYGTAELNYSGISKLADFYGVTTDYLLGREPAPNPFADLNLCPEDETAVMEKFMSLPDSFRACALELLRELAGAIKDPDVQSQTDENAD